MNSSYDIPRFDHNPVLVLMEKYVLEIIGQLPEQEQRDLAEINLQQRLHTEASDWKSAIHEFLDLSDTIHTTIEHAWYQAIDYYRNKGEVVRPEDFAASFTDAYFEENSTLDQWTTDELDRAQKRIQLFRALENN